jgi:predicted transcriptional regulator
MLANLVARYKEFKGLDAAVVVFPTDLDKCMVIGRSSPQGIDMGAVMRKLGGGGHAGAASAVIKGRAPEDLLATIEGHVRNAIQEEVLVEKIMSKPGPFMADTGITMAQAQTILSKRNVTAVMICEEKKFLGMLSSPDFAKAERSNRLETSVKGYMKRSVPYVSAGHNTHYALDVMNQSSDGVLPVIEGDLLVGVLTRGDLLLQIYDI